jgi:hypothetical protein
LFVYFFIDLKTFINFLLLGNYDTRGGIQLRQNFTFKGRSVIKNIPLSSLAPKDTVVIRSDIDVYAEKPKFA